MAKVLAGLKGKTLLTFQSVADMDAVASAIALSKMVRRAEVRATGALDSQSRAVLKCLGLKVPALESLKGYANIIVVDACTADSLGKWGRAIRDDFFGTLVIIDHHYHSGKMKADAELLLPSRSSTCEIVLGLLKAGKKRIDRKTALLLAAGIISDTAFWKSANDETFVAMSQLLSKAGRGAGDYQKIAKILQRPPDHAMTEKIVEAVRSAALREKGGIMVATTVSHAFHLQCAVYLVSLGCDYAFVADPDRGIVLAARSDYARGNIGRVMQVIAARIGGQGGGHEKVGGARGTIPNCGEALDYCAYLAFSAESG